MISPHIGAAAWAPVTPFSLGLNIDSLLSYPTQTEVVKSLVKPVNHASLNPLVVPVFPAAGCLNPILRITLPDPSSMTPRIISSKG